MEMLEPLGRLQAGMKLLVGGQQLFTVGQELAERFVEGDVLRFVEATGEVLHIPAAEQAIARDAVSRATASFARMGKVSAEQLRRLNNSPKTYHNLAKQYKREGL